MAALRSSAPSFITDRLVTDYEQQFLTSDNGSKVTQLSRDYSSSDRGLHKYRSHAGTISIRDSRRRLNTGRVNGYLHQPVPPRPRYSQSQTSHTHTNEAFAQDKHILKDEPITNEVVDDSPFCIPRQVITVGKRGKTVNVRSTRCLFKKKRQPLPKKDKYHDVTFKIKRDLKSTIDHLADPKNIDHALHSVRNESTSTKNTNSDIQIKKYSEKAMLKKQIPTSLSDRLPDNINNGYFAIPTGTQSREIATESRQIAHKVYQSDSVPDIANKEHTSKQLSPVINTHPMLRSSGKHKPHPTNQHMKRDTSYQQQIKVFPVTKNSSVTIPKMDPAPVSTSSIDTPISNKTHNSVTNKQSFKERLDAKILEVFFKYDLREQMIKELIEHFSDETDQLTSFLSKKFNSPVSEHKTEHFVEDFPVTVTMPTMSMKELRYSLNMKPLTTQHYKTPVSLNDHANNHKTEGLSNQVVDADRIVETEKNVEVETEKNVEVETKKNVETTAEIETIVQAEKNVKAETIVEPVKNVETIAEIETIVQAEKNVKAETIAETVRIVQAEKNVKAETIAETVRIVQAEENVKSETIAETVVKTYAHSKHQTELVAKTDNTEVTTPRMPLPLTLTYGTIASDFPKPMINLFPNSTIQRRTQENKKDMSIVNISYISPSSTLESTESKTSSQSRQKSVDCERETGLTCQRKSTAFANVAANETFGFVRSSCVPVSQRETAMSSSQIMSLSSTPVISNIIPVMNKESTILPLVSLETPAEIPVKIGPAIPTVFSTVTTLVSQDRSVSKKVTHSLSWEHIPDKECGRMTISGDVVNMTMRCDYADNLILKLLTTGTFAKISDDIEFSFTDMNSSTGYAVGVIDGDVIKIDMFLKELNDDDEYEFNELIFPLSFVYSYTN